MAIRTMEIPFCDVCGLPWLPAKGQARDNPRKHAKRCGKCKNPNWDYRFVRGLGDGPPGLISPEDRIKTSKRIASKNKPTT
jgi:hypothetical protein